MRPFILPESSEPALAERRARERGFSLIELIVVVVIIAVLAVIAIPAVTHQLRDRRVYQAAQEVVSIYRGARMRAMGRGAAVLVRYDATSNSAGSLTVQEAVRGTAAAQAECQRLPTSSCVLPAWVTPSGTKTTDVTDNVLVSRFDPWNRSEYSDVQLTMNGAPGDSSSGGTVTQMDVCFTPLGRAYVRYGQTGAWTALGGVPEASVWRKNSAGTAEGLTRTVMVMPSGAARFGASK